MITLHDELKTHLKAKYTILAVQTAEEQRAIRLIGEVATENKRTVWIGSITKGLYEMENEKAPDGMTADPMGLLNQIESQQTLTREYTPIPTVYILLDMHPFLEAPPVRRKIRDLSTMLKGKRSTIVLVSPAIEIPGDLQKVITVFDLPLPDKKELEDILCGRIANLKKQVELIRDEIISEPEKAGLCQLDLKKQAKLKKDLDELAPVVVTLTKQAIENKDKIVSALQGLTSIEADNVIAKTSVLRNISIATILQEKKQIVKKSGALDYWETDETQDSIGGLKNLKMWSASARNRFSEKARQYGLNPPKGVLLVGAPGTGKSLSAKAMSNLFDVPLLTLSMANMASKMYGETGNRMMSAIRLAQAMKPCIVLIDEVDKQFGTGQGNEHEESARTRGALLTAMEESEGIFWLATCNQPTNLAPELMARFPVIFHVDLPQPDERAEIFKIHLQKVKREAKNFNISELVKISEGYVGREIRNAMQEALGSAFDQNVELTTDHIVRALRQITPTAQQRKEDIDRIRKWSERNARPASEQAEIRKPAKTLSEDILTRELEV
jgi:SpoVK/Ycf46/Vps4 family AAA+-type ATPase